MASAQVHPGHMGQQVSGKLSKSRSRPVVKPILRKLQSHSERESLDLDRGWDDQPSPGLAAGIDFGPCGSDNSAAFPVRAARDVSFSFTAADMFGSSLAGGGGGGGGGGGAGTGTASGGSSRAQYSHVRTASGNSHASSTTSGRNGGSFVHPFQQTPHTSAPLLSCANPRASLDTALSRAYSPTITEHDDDVDPYSSFHSTSTTPRPALYPSAFYQRPSHRRPSLASQRTNSMSDGIPSLRPPATRDSSGSNQPFTPPSLNQGWSKSELTSPNASSIAIDTPLSSTAPLVTATTTLSSLQTPSIASSSAAPTSPLRSSLDVGGFRLRSRSEVDTATHQQQVREARRKFEERERAKEEKYSREQLRKRERAETKEAHRLERSHARLPKAGSVGHGSVSSSAMSSGTDLRISAAKTSTGRQDDTQEKVEFASHAYTSTHDGNPTAPSRPEQVQFKSSPKRGKTAKHKTVGVWTAFMLWLRTRLLKLGRH